MASAPAQIVKNYNHKEIIMSEKEKFSGNLVQFSIESSSSIRNPPFPTTYHCFHSGISTNLSLSRKLNDFLEEELPLAFPFYQPHCAPKLIDFYTSYYVQFSNHKTSQKKYLETHGYSISLSLSEIVDFGSICFRKSKREMSDIDIDGNGVKKRRERWRLPNLSIIRWLEYCSASLVDVLFDYQWFSVVT